MLHASRGVRCALHVEDNKGESMDVYAGLMAGYDGMIYLPGMVPEEEMMEAVGFLLVKLPDAQVHRLVMVQDKCMDDDDYKGPGSALIIEATCSIESHDHYGETKYFVVVQGEMEKPDATLEVANGFLDSLKGVYPELEEITV